MHYYLIKNPINFEYRIFDFKIKLVSEFKDLGIIFDSKLNFSLHSEMIKNKAMRKYASSSVLVGHLQILSL